MAGWLLFIHLTALLVVPFLDLSAWLIAVCVPVLAINLYNSWRRHVWRTHPQSISSVSWQGTDELTVTLHSGAELQATLVQRALILPWLVILHFRVAGHPGHSLLLTPDMLPDTAFRQLRARLRMAMDGTAT